MTGFGTLTSNLAAVAIFVLVIAVALKIAQRVFGTDTARAAVTESAARLVTCPTGSPAVLRRRFARALTGQCVIMPSGERLAFGRLTVRLAPEDLERLDPDADLERLGEDGAALYLTHARRERWTLPSDVRVEIEVDPVLRSGWIPPARGSGRAAPRRPLDLAPHEPLGLGWGVLDACETTALRPAAPASDEFAPGPLTPGPLTTGTVAVGPSRTSDPVRTSRHGTAALWHGDHHVVLAQDDDVVLGRLAASPLALSDPQISFRHARIRRAPHGWQIMDLDSTNGTAVDGDRLAPRTWADLRPGAVIDLCGARLRLEPTPADEGDDARPTVDALTAHR